MNIKNHKTTFGAGLTALAFSTMLTTSTHAQTCAAVPTCNELGYAQTESDCSGQYALRCPFDNSLYYCGGQKKASCTSTHTLSACPTTSNFECSYCEDNKKYRQTGCKFGYGISYSSGSTAYSCNTNCSACDDDGGIRYARSVSLSCGSSGNLYVAVPSELVCEHDGNHTKDFYIDANLSNYNGSETYTISSYSSQTECRTALRFRLPTDPEQWSSILARASQILQAKDICTQSPIH